LVVARRVEGTGQGRAQAGFEPSSLAAGDFVDFESFGQLRLFQVCERGAVRGIESGNQGPGFLVAGLPQPRNEPGVKPGGLAGQGQQPLFLVVQFADRGKHAGGGVGGPRGGSRIDDGDTVAAAGGFCGDTQSHYARADDGNMFGQL
jgi:hypothetical protein